MLGSRKEQREPPLCTCASEIYRSCWCASLHLYSLQGLALGRRDLALQQLTLPLAPETLPGLGISPLFPQRSKHLLSCFTALSSEDSWYKDVIFQCALGFFHFYYHVSKSTFMLRPCSLSYCTVRIWDKTKLPFFFFSLCILINSFIFSEILAENHPFLTT